MIKMRLKYCKQKIPRSNNKIGFSSTDFRFTSSKNTSKEAPGPGAYENKELTNEITDKVWGKNGIFGTTQTRFQHIKLKKIPPGPGSYDSKDCVKILDHKQQESNVKKQNAIFLSGSMRGIKRIPLDIQNAKFQGQEHGTIENAIKKKIIRMIGFK